MQSQQPCLYAPPPYINKLLLAEHSRSAMLREFGLDSREYARADRECRRVQQMIITFPDRRAS